MTDSCYLIQSREIIQQLIDTRQQFGIIECELCAYGDFLSAFGKCPETLPQISNLGIAKWQNIIR